MPEWVRDSAPPTRGRTTVSGGRHSDNPRSIDDSGSSKRKSFSTAPSGNPDRQNAPKLGKTSGVFAAGAWAARIEIARMLESGVSAEAIISEIHSGQESEHALTHQGGSGLELPTSRKEDEKSSAHGSIPMELHKSHGVYETHGKSRGGRDASREDRKREASFSDVPERKEPKSSRTGAMPRPPSHPPPERSRETKAPLKYPSSQRRQNRQRSHLSPSPQHRPLKSMRGKDSRGLSALG